jgi:hypothetical protein
VTRSTASSPHFSPSKLRFWYQKKAPIFLITPVNFKAREMFRLDVMNKNVRKCGYHTSFNTLFYGAYLCTFLLLLSKPLYQFSSKFVIRGFWWYAFIWSRKPQMKKSGHPPLRSIQVCHTFFHDCSYKK